MWSRGRARGSAVYYSALTALAAQARQGDDEQTANLLGVEGNRIEEAFPATHLSAYYLTCRSAYGLMCRSVSAS
ncbi:hypothetical protein, partial [Nocardioides hungaricus]